MGTPQLRHHQDETRDERGRFVTGVSGNPGGRPKTDLRRVVEAFAQQPYPAGDGTWTYHDEIARQLVSRAAAGEEPYFSADLNRVYPIVRKVESDATVTAVKSWVEIVREHHEERQREAARSEPVSDT